MREDTAVGEMCSITCDLQSPPPLISPFYTSRLIASPEENGRGLSKVSESVGLEGVPISEEKNQPLLAKNAFNAVHPTICVQVARFPSVCIAQPRNRKACFNDS